MSASYDNLSASSAATLINDVGMAGSEGPQSDIVSAFSRVQILQTQAAYFAASFARIGCDFRPHLSDLFASAILRTVQVET
ncbi:unnamed protein product [Protopolystoma xenopodis]|uniref:Uncharacterized protein n=1 Tax=Protopolystoma xenopodis TaxID=117903 RepID=A0A448X708_9PLAT|nr:unnamed protein product [Protopolystoma xenopodis]